jgi:cold shock CspA family protein
VTDESWLLDMCIGFNADLPADFAYVTPMTDKASATHKLSSRGDTSTPWSLISLFEGLQDVVIRHSGKTWPRCPLHGTHPLEATESGWECPVPGEPRRRWPYGTLSDFETPPDPKYEDGSVRWYSKRWGWGLIAHNQGDLVFREGDVRVEGLWRRELVEGTQVEFSVSAGQQGILREVEWVRRADW